jgi:hypothetical protein
LTSEEAETLYEVAREINSQQFREMTGTLATFAVPLLMESINIAYFSHLLRLLLQERHQGSTPEYHTAYRLKDIENLPMRFGARCPLCTVITSQNTRNIPCCSASIPGNMTKRLFQPKMPFQDACMSLTQICENSKKPTESLPVSIRIDYRVFI